MKVTVEEARPHHLMEVLDDVRDEDYSEWYAGTGQPFLKVATQALQSPGYKRVALLDGRPVVFWGMSKRGAIWLFATTHAVTNFIPLHRILRKQLGEMHSMCPTLTALADDRNTVHQGWLRWLGFRKLTTEFLEPFGLPFTLFYKEAT